MSTLKMNGSSWAALILLIALAVSMSPVASHAERADEVSADAVYKEARELLARDSFREAAERFREISNSYNDSKYTADALYWEAFSLYRLGRLNELKEAMGVLERQIGLYPEAKTRGDALELATRIRGELARRGDADAAEKLAEQVMQLEEREARALTAERNGREGEKDKVDETKLAALQALINMDSDRALPILKKIMQKRDKDSERLRVEALFLIAQHKNDETEELLLDIIQNDPSLEVRKHAVFWLSEIPGEKSLNTLIDILNKSDQSALQEEALFALSNKKGERAREVLKSLALNEKASEEIREQAIFWLGQRRGEATTVFLKQLYSSLKEESLKENVLYALSESKDSDVGKWLFDVALNESESIELRKQALFWAGQSKQATLPELERLYKTMTNAEMREQILFVLSQMNNEDSVTMLMEIAKTEQDSELRRQAIFWLGQSKDPRAIDVLEKILTE